MLSLKIFATVVIVTVNIISNFHLCKSSPVSAVSHMGSSDLEDDSMLFRGQDPRVSLRDLNHLRTLLALLKDENPKRRFKEVKVDFLSCYLHCIILLLRCSHIHNIYILTFRGRF